VDGAVSGGDSTVSSISPRSFTSEYEHKDRPRCFSKSKVRFYLPGCWGREMSSPQTHIIYGVNTEKESESLGKEVVHSSYNGSGNITVTIAGHSLVCTNSVIMAAQTATLLCLQITRSVLCVGSVCKS